MYEITFAGQAGPVLRAEFDDCEVTVGPATTTLRVELPDPPALAGLSRIAAAAPDLAIGLGYDVAAALEEP